MSRMVMPMHGLPSVRGRWLRRHGRRADAAQRRDCDRTRASVCARRRLGDVPLAAALSGNRRAWQDACAANGDTRRGSHTGGQRDAGGDVTAPGADRAEGADEVAARMDRWLPDLESALAVLYPDQIEDVLQR